MNRWVIYCWIFTVAFLGYPSPVISANSLDVEFSGEFLGTACRVASESINQKITLHNLRWQFINENERSAVTPFTIAIDKCNETDLQKSIKLTWKSNELITINGDSFLSTKGDSHVVLGLVDENEKPITWNKPIAVGYVSVVEGVQQLDFGVFVRKPATGKANTGDFSSIVTFNVEYE